MKHQRHCKLNHDLSRDFALEKPSAYSGIKRLIKVISRDVNHYRLNYDHLKRIFQEVREQTGIEVPRKRQKLVELPTRQQISIFLESIKNPIHKLIFKFLLGTGLRVSEATKVEVKNIDFEKNQILIKEGKMSKDRIVLFSDNLKNDIQIFLAGKNNRFLFETNRFTKFSTRRIQQLSQIYSKKSGIHITPHTCRHIFATLLATEGISEDHRKVLCGHSKNSNAQQIYTHLSLNGIKENALKALNKHQF